MTVSVTRDPKCAKMRKYRPTEELGSSTDGHPLRKQVELAESEGEIPGVAYVM